VDEQAKRILIVEDDDGLRDLLVLEMTGEPAFHLTSVGDGSQALELVHEVPFDLVVLDLQLPGASGLDILTTIQRDSPGTEVIVLTGLAPDDPRVVEALRRVEHLLEKPFPPEQVVGLVRSCLTSRDPVAGRQSL
jgi:DNA-binding response OmpR family regulator